MQHHYSGHYLPDQKSIPIMYNASRVSVSPTSFRFMESECLFQSQDIHDGFGGQRDNETNQLLTLPFCTSLNPQDIVHHHHNPSRIVDHSAEFGDTLETGRHVPRNDILPPTNDDMGNVNDDHFGQFSGFNVQMNDSYIISNQILSGGSNVLDTNGDDGVRHTGADGNADLLVEADDALSFAAGMKMMKRKAAPTLATGRRSKDDTLPPDEHEKRQLRRERNKIAAAKCRRRRADLTRELEEKTSKLTNEKEALERQILQLSEDKYKLESFIMTHQKSCERFRNELRNSAILNEIAANINRRSV